MKNRNIIIYLLKLLSLTFIINLFIIPSGVSSSQQAPAEKRSFKAEITYPLISDNVTLSNQNYLEIRTNLVGIESFQIFFKEENENMWHAVSSKIFPEHSFEDEIASYLPLTRIQTPGKYLLQLRATDINGQPIQDQSDFTITDYILDFANITDPASGKKITDNDQSNNLFNGPKMSEKYIIWSAGQNSVDPKIVLWDIIAQTKKDIILNPGSGASQMTVSNTHVFWTQTGETNTIHIYNIATETKSTFNGVGVTNTSGISGLDATDNHLIYHINDYAAQQIVFQILDLNTMQTRNIVTYPLGYFSKSSISENNIFWTNTQANPGTIYYHNISLNTTRGYPFSDVGASNGVDAYKDKFVFTNSLQNVYLFDLTTETRTRIINTGIPYNLPNTIALNRNRLVHSVNGDLYEYKLDSQYYDPIIQETGDQKNPQLSNNCLTWLDQRNDENDIYLKCENLTTEDLNSFDFLHDGSGPQLVFSGLGTSGFPVIVRDFNKKEDFSFTANANELPKLHIQGPIISYEKKNAGQYDIYTTNTITKNTKPLITNSRDQFNPEVIGGKYVLYEEKPNSISDFYTVHIVDIDTGISRRLSENGTHAFGAKYSESTNNFIWFVMPQFSNPNGYIKKCKADLINMTCASTPEIIAQERFIFNIHWQLNETPKMDVSGDYLIFPKIAVTSNNTFERAEVEFIDLNNGFQRTLLANIPQYNGTFQNTSISGSYVIGSFYPLGSSSQNARTILFDIRNNDVVDLPDLPGDGENSHAIFENYFFQGRSIKGDFSLYGFEIETE